MTIAAARTGTFEEFMDVYDGGASVGLDDLLASAVRNTDPDARAAIADRLLTDGASADLVTDGYNVLSIILGARRHSPVAEAALIARLIEGGIDVNFVSKRGERPVYQLATMIGVSDEDAVPIYDALLASPELDLTFDAPRAGSGVPFHEWLLEGRVPRKCPLLKERVRALV